MVQVLKSCRGNMAGKGGGRRPNFALSTKIPEMEKEPTIPPPIEDDGNGLSDTDLLNAISTHPDAAHALAAIAAGADVTETLASLLPSQPDKEPDNADESMSAQTPAPSLPVASPSFLGSTRTDFWDESFF